MWRLNAVCVALLLTGIHGVDSWIFSLQRDAGDTNIYRGVVVLQPTAQDAAGNVCFDDASFSDTTALAVCNQLGFPIPSGFSALRTGVSAGESVFYMAGLSCGSTTQSLDTCSFSSGTSPATCNADARFNALFIDCGETIEGGSPVPTAAPWIFEMKFFPLTNMDSNTFSDNFIQAIVAFFNTTGVSVLASRVTVLDIIVGSPPADVGGNNSFYVTWQFAAASNGDIDRGALEEVTLADHAIMFPASLNLTWTNIEQPTSAPKPSEPYNASQFQFRLADSQVGWPYSGRLEIMPGTNGSWGTVCNDMWTMTDSIAACRSLGFHNAGPWQITPDLSYPLSRGVVVLSNVTCLDTNMFLTECSFVYSTADNKQSPEYCSHEHDVWLNCYYTVPPPTTMNPSFTWAPDAFTEIILWTVEVNTSVYTNLTQSNASAVSELTSNVIAMLCDFIGVTPERILVVGDVILGTLSSFVNFEFTQPLSMMDPVRMQYDAFLQWATPSMLQQRSILSLLSNATANYTNGGSNEDTSDGPFVLQVDDNDRGLVLIRPKNINQFKYDLGTICSKPEFDANAAYAVCLGMMNPTKGSFDVAGAIPYFGAPQGLWTWLSTVRCAQGANLPNCTYAIYTDKQDPTASNCSNVEAAGVICALQRAPVVPPAYNAAVYTYNAIFRVGQFDQSHFHFQLAQHFPINSSRLVFTNLTMDVNGQYYNVEFFFADNDAWDVGREDYDYFFQHIGPDGLLSLFGIVSMSYQFGRPNLPVTAAPYQWHNTSGWMWRLVSSAGADSTTSAQGLLEVLPYGEAEWGTVCSTGFGIQEATAACHSLGFVNLSYAFASNMGSGGWGVGPIYVSEVWCPDPNSERYIQNCSFQYASNGVDTGCTHTQDVYLDCTGNNTGGLPTYEHRSFTSVVLTVNHTDTAFAQRWARYFNMSTDRIVVFTPHYNYSSFSYVNWTIIDDNNTIHIPTGGGSNGGGSMMTGDLVAQHLVGLEAKNGTTGNSGSFPMPPDGWSQMGSFSMPGMGSMNLGVLPSEVLETVISELYAGTLWGEFGIFEQRDNLTQPNGPLNPDRSTWTFSLDSLDESLNDHFGRVRLQPGAGAMYGSVCSRGTDATFALALCRQRVPSQRLATVIPFFRPMVGGVIYLSNAHCGQSTGNISACNFSVSTFWEKNNPCTHLEDVGVLCGRGIIPDPPVPVTYAAYVALPALDPQFCSNATEFLQLMAAVTNIPVSRFSLTSCMAVTNDTIPKMYLEEQPIVDDSQIPQYVVNFTFTESTNASQLTRGDLDLILQATNEWALETYAHIKILMFSQFLVTSQPSGLPVLPTTDIPSSTTITTAPITTTSTTSSPAGSTSAPAGSTSAPAGSTSAPAGSTGAPAGSTSAPASTSSPGTVPPPSSDTPTPTAAQDTVVLLAPNTTTFASLQSSIASALKISNTSFGMTFKSTSSGMLEITVVFASANDAVLAAAAAKDGQLGSGITLLAAPGTPAPQNVGSSKPAIGAIVGGAVGGVVGVALIGLAVKLIFFKAPTQRLATTDYVSMNAAFGNVELDTHV